MHNRLYIFSSRFAASALLWTVVLVAAVEVRSAYVLPREYSSHEVDLLLLDLDHKSYRGQVLFMGDSVGRQVGQVLCAQEPDKIFQLACNAAVETAGQYFIFRRYADRNAMPRKVILMMGNPLVGNLENVYVENFVQRCFLHWSEILDLAIEKKDPVFTGMMIAYKLLPSLRYRLHVQNNVPGLKAPDIYSGGLDLAKAGGGMKTGMADHGLMTLFKTLRAGRNPCRSVSLSYFERLVECLDRKNVQLIFVPPPQPESHRSGYGAGGSYGRQLQMLEEISKRNRHLSVVLKVNFYPDDWFRDGLHLKRECLETVVKDYSNLLDDKS